jgi:site-specific DNA-methyltransferase (cytosine-N4-specific)
MEEKFTYGDQFSVGTQVELKPTIETVFAVVKQSNGGLFGQQDKAGDRELLQRELGAQWFDHTSNPFGNAGNTVLSLNAYDLIDIDKGGSYKPTELAGRLRDMDKDQAEQEFARHILTELNGMLLLKVIEDMRARGEAVGLEAINYELQDLGFDIPPNSTYVSTMKSWLHRVGVFKTKSYSSVDWEVVRNLTGVDKEFVDDVYDLNLVQKYFLLALVHLGATDFVKSNGVAEHVRSVFKIKVTTKNLVKEVIEPLQEKGLVEAEKTTGGRGAKPHNVKLADSAINDVLRPFIENLSELTGLAFPTLNKSFEEAVAELDSDSKHVKGEALEILSIWIVRLLGLRFTEWRERAASTGHGEVDVMAASDRFIYNRWQIQCKNTKSSVSVDVLAKEYGLSVITKADVITVVTTSHFTPDAKRYADELMNQSRFYVLLLDGDDIRKVTEDRTAIVDILNDKAERVFYQKEILSRFEKN